MQGNGEVVASRSSVSLSLQLNTLAEIKEFCEVLSKTNMVPKAYQDKPGDILVAIIHGQEVGLPHLQALQSIAVVNGIPSIYGDAALAMVRASGKLEDFDEWIEVDGVRQEGSFPILKYADEKKEIVAYCKSKRVGMSRPRVTSYSVDDARRAKLWEKKGSGGFETPWCTVPQRMLMWRARGWNLRDQFGDVLKGLAIYEEAMDIETTKGTDGVHRPVVELLPEPVRDEMKEALRAGQETLRKQQEEKKPEAKAQQDKPKEEAPTEEAAPKFLTFSEAKNRLELAESATEIANVMNLWGENAESTPEQRKAIIDLKDRTMKSLSKKK